MKLVHVAVAAGVVGVVLSTPADAQFGGLSKMLGKSSQTSSGDESDLFLDQATKSTKNVMIAAAILAQTVTDAKNLTARKSYVVALTNAQNVKDLDAHRSEFSSDLDTINKDKDFAASVGAAFNASPQKEREQIGIAVVNLVIGIARNIQLADEAPKVVGSIGHNPMLLTRAGQFKIAASLVGLQAKGLTGVATSIPKLVSATKVRAPADPKTSEPTAVSL